MSICKLCKKTVVDGTDYCDECTDKKDLIDNESYLDDLLSSVQGKTTDVNEIYNTKKGDQKKESPDVLLSLQKDPSYIDDLNDFKEFDIMKELDEPIIISDQPLESSDTAESLEIQVESETPDETEVSDYQEREEISEDVLVDSESLETEQNIDNEFLEMEEKDIHSDNEDEYIEPVLDELLNQLGLSDDNDDTDIDTHDRSESLEEVNSMEEKEEAQENELLDLLNQFNPENSVEDDIQAISDLLGGIATDDQAENDYPEDVGEVFSEALEAVSSLSDPDNKIKYISQEPRVSKTKGPGLFAKLFANVDDDLDPAKKKAKEKRAEKKQRKKKAKEELAAAEQVETEESQDEDRQDTETKEEKKKRRKEERQKKKEQKKAQKKIEFLEDEVDEGRINRVGASIVFMFFGILVILLLISTNIFSYSLSIRNATEYFGRQRYTQAYNEVYGIELKDEDIELYDKIMTVMFVNKQLNSYNNHYNIKKYPEALDSLLKGLQRYDKYVELATMLGIKTDLDYVRDQIIAELYNVFSLTEEDAVNIINSNSQVKYSMAVYDVVLENITYYNTN